MGKNSKFAADCNVAADFSRTQKRAKRIFSIKIKVIKTYRFHLLCVRLKSATTLQPTQNILNHLTQYFLFAITRTLQKTTK